MLTGKDQIQGFAFQEVKIIVEDLQPETVECFQGTGMEVHL